MQNIFFKLRKELFLEDIFREGKYFMGASPAPLPRDGDGDQHGVDRHGRGGSQQRDPRQRRDQQREGVGAARRGAAAVPVRGR